MMLAVATGTQRVFVKSLGTSSLTYRSDPLKWLCPIHSIYRRLATSRTHEKGVTQAQPEGVEQRRYRSWGRRPRCRIRTLDPARLTPDDYFDISSQASVSLNVTLQPGGGAAVQASLYARFMAPSSPGRFPPNTRGYFYYHVPPHCPPIGGELRFRITPSWEPARFAAGSDLLIDRGTHWNLPLYKMVYRDSFQRVLALLLQDGLVSQQTLDLAKSAAAKSRLDTHRPTGGHAGTPVVWAFGQEFEMRTGARRRGLCVFVGADSVFRKELWHPFGFAQRDSRTPFEGSIVCCFERSTLPEHAGKRVVVLRAKRLQESDPVPPVDIPDDDEDSIEELRPREGELLKTMHRGETRVWAVDVDKPSKSDMATGTMLRILFENEKLYGSFQNPEMYSET